MFFQRNEIDCFFKGIVRLIDQAIRTPGLDTTFVHFPERQLLFVCFDHSIHRTGEMKNCFLQMLYASFLTHMRTLGLLTKVIL